MAVYFGGRDTWHCESQIGSITMREFLEILAKYVSCEQPFSVVEEWLAGVDWDDPNLTQENKEIFGLFELLTTEVSEGLRDQQELIGEAITLLMRQGQNVFLNYMTVEATIQASSVDAPIILVTPEQGQRTWSISPQLVI